MTEKEFMKKAIIHSWVSNGLTKDAILEQIEGLEKRAVVEATSDIFFKTLPAFFFGVPLIGGGLTYVLTHPDIIKMKAYTDAKKQLEKEIMMAKGSVLPKGITL
jgi:hypothetical protein